MKKIFILLISTALISTIFSCKNEVKETETADRVTEETPAPQKSREMTEEEKFSQSSVLSKAMATPELSTFVSFSVSAGLSDVLSKEAGPYTMLAPTSEAFKERSAMLRSYQHIKKKDSLDRIIGSHIIEGNLDSATMVSNIRNGNGSYVATTYTGEKLTFKRDGMDIIVQDAYGNEATLGKTDIVGGNGVVHVINRVLILN